MEMTIRRSLAWFAVGAALIVAGEIGTRARDVDRVVRSNDTDNAVYREQRARDRAGTLARTVDLLQFRDSLRRVVRALPPSAGLTVLANSALPPGLRTRADSVVRAFWSAEMHGPARIPFVVFLTMSEAAGYRGFGTLRPALILTPDDLDGRACAFTLMVAANVRTVRDMSARKAQDLRSRLDDLAGPCIFAARYGMMGEGVHQWLAASSYDPGLSVLPAVAEDKATSRARQERKSQRTTEGWLRSLGFSGQWDGRYAAAPLACATGKKEWCVDSAGPGARASSLERDPFLPTSVVVVWRDWGFPRRAVSIHTVARMERELGPERFAKVWQSNQPLEESLTAASGASFTEFAYRVTVEQIGALRSSPWPTGAEWLGWLALCGVTIAALIASSRHREVSV